MTDALINAIAEAVHNECMANIEDGPYVELPDDVKAPYQSMVRGMLGTFLGLGYRIHRNDWRGKAQQLVGKRNQNQAPTDISR